MHQLMEDYIMRHVKKLRGYNRIRRKIIFDIVDRSPDIINTRSIITKCNIVRYHMNTYDIYLLFSTNEELIDNLGGKFDEEIYKLNEIISLELSHRYNSVLNDISNHKYYINSDEYNKNVVVKFTDDHINTVNSVLSRFNNNLNNVREVISEFNNIIKELKLKVFNYVL